MKHFRVVKKHGGYLPEDLVEKPKDGSYYCTVLMPGGLVCARKAVNLNRPPWEPGFFCKPHLNDQFSGVVAKHHTVIVERQMKRVEGLVDG